MIKNAPSPRVKNFTRHFDISPATTRIGIVQYSSIPQIEFKLSQSSDFNAISSFLDDLKLLGGNTRTGQAMDTIAEQVFSNEESRNEASKVLILLSDGQSQDKVKASADKLLSKDIITFSVGVGNQGSTRLDELLEIANGEEAQVFSARNFDSIFNLQKELATKVCTFVQQDCPEVIVDLAFVIDGSTTIGTDNFLAYKTFMTKVLDNFQIGEENTRVSVVQYASVVREEFPLNKYFNKDEIVQAIEDIEWLTGNTATNDAIHYLVDTSFSREHGGRPEAPDLVIILTDGKAQNHTAVEEASKRLHDSGAVVYSVGIGDAPSLNELQDIASDPDETFVLQAADFSLLLQKERPLINSICKNDQVYEEDPTCPNAAADVIFMVDGSSSVGRENFENFKTWMKKIVDSFKVGNDYVKFGIVQYNTEPNLEFSLEDEQVTSNIMTAISEMELRGGGTQTGLAVNFTTDLYKHSERPKVLIVLTDGESQDKVLQSATIAQKNDVMIFSVGVAEADMGELTALSQNNTQRIWRGTPYEYIDEMRTELIAAICTDIEPKCANQEIDIQFLVDSSGSVGEKDYDLTREWIKNVINSFDVGEYTTNFGLTQFTAKVRDEFKLTEKLTKPQIMAKIDDMVYVKGKTSTGKALLHTAEALFDLDNNQKDSISRKNVPKVLILLTDGSADDKVNKGVRKLKEGGVHIFAIGIGDNVILDELKSIATQPAVTHVKNPESFQNINQFRKELVEEICQETKPEHICDAADVDIAFLIDSSGSIHPDDYELQKEWIKDFADGFNLEYYNVAFSVVQFAKSVSVEFDFTRNSSELHGAVDMMQQIGGQTYTGNAMEYLRVRVGGIFLKEKI